VTTFRPIFSHFSTHQRDRRDFSYETTGERKERRTMCIRLARSTRIRFACTMTLIQDYFPSLIILPPFRPPSPPPLGINAAVAITVVVFSLSLAERTESPARDAIMNYLYFNLSSRTRFLGRNRKSPDDNDISQEMLHSLWYSSQKFCRYTYFRVKFYLFFFSM